MKFCLLLFFYLLCVGCTNQKIYLFARYIEPKQTEKIETELEKIGFEVESNNHYFPAKVEDNTLVHSLTFKQGQVNRIKQILSLLDYSNISNEFYSFTGKHFFSRDSFGLYLFPTALDLYANKRQAAEKLFKQDLVGVYETQISCSTQSYIELKSDASFVQVEGGFDSKIEDKLSSLHRGKWILIGAKLELIYYNISSQQVFNVSAKTASVGPFLQRLKILSPQNQLLPLSSYGLGCRYQKSLMETNQL